MSETVAAAIEHYKTLCAAYGVANEHHNVCKVAVHDAHEELEDALSAMKQAEVELLRAIRHR
jgi:hypothetical protein